LEIFHLRKRIVANEYLRANSLTNFAREKEGFASVLKKEGK
jgi:hypothetical protein